VETYTLLDVAGRVSFVRRGPQAPPLMTAMYTYYANGQVQSVTYGNGASIWYTYDNGNRLQQIVHKDWTFQVLHTLHYTYNNRDLPTLLTESGTAVPAATTTFEYDDRGKLISETRISAGDDDYDITYVYDQVGNRTYMADTLTGQYVEYSYDTDVDPEDPEPPYESRNNRLMFYKTYDGGGLLSTTWYIYNDCGNVTRVISKDERQTPPPEVNPMFTSTWLEYGKNGSAVTYVVGESWRWDEENEPDDHTYVIYYGREYRYDGARQRYLNRELDPWQLRAGNRVEVPAGTFWSDYDGDEIYGDFTAVDATISRRLTRRLPTYARLSWGSQGSSMSWAFR